MGAAKRPRARKIGHRRGFPSRHHAMLADENVGERRLRPRDRNDSRRPGARLEPRIDGPARLVVDADERNVGLRDQPLLDRGVAGEIAVSVEMVGRDVDEKSDAGAKRGREIDLIGRTFDDMHPSGGGRRQVENRHADIAAHRDLASGLLEHMGDQRGGRRFAVGAGDRDEGRVRRSRAALAREQLDVADDRNPRLVREIDGPMRLRMGQRHAGRRARTPGTRASRLERDRPAERPPASARSRAAGLSSQAATSAPPATSARAVDSPEPAEAEEGDALSTQGLDRRHRHLSFSEARPTIASTKAMIQKRMTICGSDQPSCSK